MFIGEPVISNGQSRTKQVYIFEFKVNDTAASALQQIKDRDYAAPYRASGREIVLVGIALSKTRKGISDLLHEIVK